MPELSMILIPLALWGLGLIFFSLLLYVIIRQGVFHGLRAHTRWIDQGKD